MCKHFIIVTLILVVCSFSFAAELRFPPYITICKRNTDAMKCVMENIEKCRPHLAKGIPKLLIPPMSPLNLPQLEIDGNNLHINLKNLKVHNLEAVQIVDGKVEFDNFKLNLNVKLPYIYHEFDYEAMGKILLLNFNGKGAGYINASDVDINIDSRAHTKTKDGKQYLVVDDIVFKYKAGDGKVQIDNLFAGQKELNDQTNRLINENFHEFENEISPDISKSVASVIKTIATAVLEKYSFDELFPVE